ncbi:hypothetical protein MHYP_G00239130 [Metynnis hypsauchen]
MPDRAQSRGPSTAAVEACDTDSARGVSEEVQNNIRRLNSCCDLPDDVLVLVDNLAVLDCANDALRECE